MFVLIHNNFVILGPVPWKRFRFENIIQEECEVTATLPDRNDGFQPIIVNDEIKILPYALEQNPPYDPKIQMLNGPFWEFTDTHAVASYRPEYLPLEAAKNMLKDRVTANRYTREVKGTKVTIRDQEYTVDTSREGRNVFVQKYLLMAEGDICEWKFPEGWVVLSKSELGQVVNAGALHIQNAFSWESAKLAEVDSVVDLMVLPTIDIGDPVVQPPNLGV